MRIGIITWFENLNFGTALQAYALQHYLKASYGYDVSVIKYNANSANMLSSLAQKTEHLPYKLYQKIKNKIYDSYQRYDDLLDTVYIKEKNNRQAAFNSFLDSNISFTNRVGEAKELEALCDSFDLFICGSDQIWNPQILDSNYYLNFAKDKPKVSYATSFGIEYIPDYAKPYIKEYLRDFKAISLREKSCKDELEKLLNSPVSVVADPTFLLGAEHWRSIASKRIVEEKYFTTYFLGDTKLERKAFDIAQNELGIKNIILPCTEFAINRSQSENIEFGPSDFISIIDNSEYVVTDSFHAVCFSIMLQKNFCVLKKHSNSNPFKQNSRIESLLEILGISECLVDNEAQLTQMLKKDIDYTEVNKRLEKYIENSKEFIKESICNE